MTCPRCNANTSVADSRAEVPHVVRRRRVCESAACLHKFTTYEISEDAVAQELVVGVAIFMQGGKITTRTTVQRRCPCGKPAKYVVPGESEPRFCRSCNGGRGHPIARVRSELNAAKGLAMTKKPNANETPSPDHNPYAEQPKPSKTPQAAPGDASDPTRGVDSRTEAEKAQDAEGAGPGSKH